MEYLYEYDRKDFDEIFDKKRIKEIRKFDFAELKDFNDRIINLVKNTFNVHNGKIYYDKDFKDGTRFVIELKKKK